MKTKDQEIRELRHQLACTRRAYYALLIMVGIALLGGLYYFATPGPVEVENWEFTDGPTTYMVREFADGTYGIAPVDPFQ